MATLPQWPHPVTDAEQHSRGQLNGAQLTGDSDAEEESTACLEIGGSTLGIRPAATANYIGNRLAMERVICGATMSNTVQSKSLIDQCKPLQRAMKRLAQSLIGQWEQGSGTTNLRYTGWKVAR